MCAHAFACPNPVFLVFLLSMYINLYIKLLHLALIQKSFKYFNDGFVKNITSDWRRATTAADHLFASIRAPQLHLE